MKEKIYELIKERNPWLLKNNLISKTTYTLLKKYLRYEETVFVGDHIQSMTGEEAFNWLGSEYTSNSSVEGLENESSYDLSLNFLLRGLGCGAA